ncbi:MAG: carbohydrate-binding family V/XII, partial [Thermoanaerobaculia bacterium]
DQGYLLTWVAGTEMAEEAILDASIPQTAAIKRNATITVTYDGHPRFEAIEGTSLRYAANTEYQVIQAGEEYYCAYEGAWYVAGAPNGAWRVATEVPDEIRSIPPSSPAYNTKYVYIYDSTPEVVYVGYYPGYTYSYVYYGVPVYGTGWYYRPWYGSYYYPRASTWGFHVRYNPWYGWSCGFSYSTGRFTFSLGYGGWYRGGWWGPVGYRGYHRGYNRGWHHGYSAGAHSGYRAGYHAAKRDTARNMYHRQGNAGRVASTEQVRSARAAGATGAAATRTPNVSSTRANNVYTDKGGNVHRQQPDGSWQTREGGQWKTSDMAGAAGSRAGTADVQRPATSGTPTQRPSGTTGTTRQQPTGSTGGYGGSAKGSGGSSLNSDAYARQRGTQRTQSYQSSGASRGGGGRSRGGGRRR